MKEKILVFVSQNSSSYKLWLDKPFTVGMDFELVILPLIFDESNELCSIYKNERELIRNIRGIKYIMIVGGVYFHNLDTIINNFGIKHNYHPKLVNVCLSVDQNLYVTYDKKECLLHQKRYWESGVRQLSHLIHNTQWVEFEPTIWLTSFYCDIPNLQSLYDNNDRRFLDGRFRLGISVHRLAEERCRLVQLIHRSSLPNVLYTIHNAEASQRCGFTQSEMEDMIRLRNKWLRDMDKGGMGRDVSLRWWEDGYRLFNLSKIEIVMETFKYNGEFEHNNVLSNWQRMFTEKILKPLINGKPFLIADPSIFKLFLDWGFEVDEGLYGSELLNLYSEWEFNRDYNYEQWLPTFYNRIEEISKMSERDFNSMYTSSLLLSQRNKAKIKRWKWWYEGIERWFGFEEKVVQMRDTKRGIYNKIGRYGMRR